jgi:hypothetical protein
MAVVSSVSCSPPGRPFPSLLDSPLLSGIPRLDRYRDVVAGLHAQGQH